MNASCMHFLLLLSHSLVVAARIDGSASYFLPELHWRQSLLLLLLRQRDTGTSSTPHSLLPSSDEDSLLIFLRLDSLDAIREFLLSSQKAALISRTSLASVTGSRGDGGREASSRATVMDEERRRETGKTREKPVPHCIHSPFASFDS